jgi:hypothetical protein
MLNFFEPLEIVGEGVQSQFLLCFSFLPSALIARLKRA